MSAFEFSLLGWSAWAPGLETKGDWIDWWSSPGEVLSTEAPKLRSLPANLRRRIGQLGRMSLEAAQRCAAGAPGSSGGVAVDAVQSIFGSRHGECRTSQMLLETLGRGELLSPLAFGLSVHNTASGLFSIAAENQQQSTAISAGKESFCCMLLEALAAAAARPEEPVLAVFGDELVPDTLAEFVAEERVPHALALLLQSGSGDVPGSCRLQLRLDSRQGAWDEPCLPLSLAFVKWLLSGEPELELRGERLCWRFRQSAGAGEFFAQDFSAVQCG